MNKLNSRLSLGWIRPALLIVMLAAALVVLDPVRTKVVTKTVTVSCPIDMNSLIDQIVQQSPEVSREEARAYVEHELSNFSRRLVQNQNK